MKKEWKGFTITHEWTDRLGDKLRIVRCDVHQKNEHGMDQFGWQIVQVRFGSQWCGVVEIPLQTKE